MSRLALHLLVALVTFLVGFATASVLPLPRHHTPTQDLLVTREAKLTTIQLDLDVVGPKFTFDYDPKKFNPRGDFFIIGRKPKAFSEFSAFELATDGDTASGDVGLETYANKMYNSDYTVSGQVTNKRLTFIASLISETEYEYYSFDGYFLRGGAVANAGKNTAVLKGRLRKVKGGVKLAESEVKFRIEYLGC